MTWKRCPHCWPFLPVDSAHKGPVLRSFDILFVISLKKLLNKQPSFQWFETPWCWCDVTAMFVSLRCYALILCILWLTFFIPMQACHRTNYGSPWVKNNSCLRLIISCVSDIMYKNIRDHPSMLAYIMMTSSNGNILRVTSVTGGFPSPRPVTRTFDVFFDVRLTNGWISGVTGDLRRHDARCNISVIFGQCWLVFLFLILAVSNPIIITVTS